VDVRLWNIGKIVGITHLGENHNIIERIREMNDRDNNTYNKEK